MYPYATRHPGRQSAVVFDCDGLLISTQGAWDRAYAQLTGRYGVRLTSRDRHSLVGLQMEALGHALAELLGRPAPPAQLATEIYDMVRDGAGNGHTPMPGAINLVNVLRGTRPLAVASNTPQQIVAGYLQDADILDAFDAIICSDQVDHPKPAPDVYLAACRKLRCDPGSCLALEDSPTGAIAALTAGLYLIGVPSAPDLIFPAHQHATTLNDHLLWQSLGLMPRTLSA
ncbi:MAG TPA: HAD family phosphatase [Streptosporangiaceae bacterium]|jgi:HAD superfamily hydrolase (TIGR01509 family)